jgi:EpsI family protein
VNFLSNIYVRILTVLLMLQGVVFYAVVMRPEQAPAVGPLSLLPKEVPGWNMYREGSVEPEVQDILKADDLLTRDYVNESKTAAANLFIAFFKTQREGQAPHSPKNCLPGSGFEPIESYPITIQLPGRSETATINRYLTARGEEKSVTLYWYQSHGRIIAGEFAAKLWLIADSVRYHRSDTALVRIVVPVAGDNADVASRTAVEFAKAIFPAVNTQLPL